MSYEIRKLLGKGNSVIATKKFNKGDFILKDSPHYFYIFNSLTDLHSEINLTNSKCLCNHCCLYFNKCIHLEEYSCNNCGISYCSQKCRDSCTLKSSASVKIAGIPVHEIDPTSDGHRWICRLNKGLLKQLESHTLTNFFRIALQCYAVIAESAYQSMKCIILDASSNTGSFVIDTVTMKPYVQAAAAKAMEGYQSADYCLSVHRLLS